MAFYAPATARREAPLEAGAAALLIVDAQVYNCSREGAIYKALSASERAAPETRFFYDAALPAAEASWRVLLAAARAAGVEVIHTVIQSLTADGRDRGLDYKLSGFHVPPGSPDAAPVAAAAPAGDEVVLPKSSSSAFNSTVLDRLLRNLGVTQLVIAGCVTDQCVEHAVRDACDLGYLVTLVPDACATHSLERHERSVAAVAGYCRRRSTEQVVAEMAAIATSRGGVDAIGNR
jgi:ureidoacrylate peracid hydrolase